MEFVELGGLSFADWVGLVRHERAPFGEAASGLTYRSKDHHVAARDDDGRLLGAIGATLVTVAVEGHEPIEVVGVGGLIIRRDVRDLGLGRELMRRQRLITATLGPDRAMIFCEQHLIETYARRDYVELHDAVWVDQPDGPIQMPMRAMWRAIRPTDWPVGVVRVDGYPF